MRTEPPSRAARWLPLLLPLLAGLALRLLLWDRLPRTGLISDEGEYLAAADWLAHGRGFAWYLAYLWTRAPLYPLVVAAHAWLFQDPRPALFITQTALSLLNVALVYALARQALPRRGAMIAALLTALYLPFALYTQIVLSETLYLTLLLGGFLALVGHRSPAARSGDAGRVQTSQIRSFILVLVAGVLLGLATLTRSLTLGFLPLAAIWLWWGGEGQSLKVKAQSPGGEGQSLKVKAQSPVAKSQHGARRAFRLSTFNFQLSTFVVAAALTILPWTVYNSRAYGGLVILDTSGAYNLLLGARTAWDGTRSDAPTRDFVRALLDERLKVQSDREALVADACLKRRADPRLTAALQTPPAQITQSQRQTLMTAEGLCLIAERPLAFVRKSAGELLDFFQINYSGDERFTDAFTTGRLPPWYALALFLLDDTLYVLTLPLAVLGLVRLWRARAPLADARSGAPLAPLARGQFWLSWLAGGLATPGRRLAALIMLWWLYTIGVAPLLFAINRFRVPLLPFAFICVAALMMRSGGRADPPDRLYRRTQIRGSWSIVHTRWPIIIALILFLIAAVPSYVGPYPSSVWSTWLALDARATYERTEAFRAALGADPARAAALRDSGPIVFARRAKVRAADDPQLAQALLALAERRPADALAALPDSATILADGDVEAALVRADALRTSGDQAGARALMTDTSVDNANPVDWAWDWLRPADTRRIDLGGNLDLGYLRGCYLGEGIRTERTTFRWCTDGAQLRFPGAGRNAPQTLTLLADARGWPADLLPNPPVRVLINGSEVGSFTPDTRTPQRYTLPVPPTADGAAITVTLRMTTFVPDAARYLSQQGALVGQLQRLGVRLDTVELGP